MRSPSFYSRKILQAPLVILMLAMIIIVEVADFLVDHINTPIANLIDTACISIMEELGPHATMIVGGAMHAYLYKFYLAGTELSVPALNNLLIFCGHEIAPIFGIIADSIIPALSFALPYLLMSIAGIVVFNELVCMKKIFAASNTDGDVQNINLRATNRLETMRSRPIESVLKITMRLANKAVNMPAFVVEAYEMAGSIKDKIAARLLPWQRTPQPLIMTQADTQLITEAAAGAALPMEQLDSNVVEHLLPSERSNTYVPSFNRYAAVAALATFVSVGSVLSYANKYTLN